MARQELQPDGTFVTLERYAQFVGDTVRMVIESKVDPDGVNGEWVACPDDVGPGFTANAQRTVWTPPVAVAPVVPRHSTKRAFQNRFPKMANGISTKWDAMCLFLVDDGYAASLGVSGADLYALRMLITTGQQRMNASPYVDMAPGGEAASLTGLLMQTSIPIAFRLSAAERTAMLDTPLAEEERYKG